MHMCVATTEVFNVQLLSHSLQTGLERVIISLKTIQWSAKVKLCYLYTGRTEMATMCDV